MFLKDHRKAFSAVMAVVHTVFLAISISVVFSAVTPRTKISTWNHPESTISAADSEKTEKEESFGVERHYFATVLLASFALAVSQLILFYLELFRTSISTSLFDYLRKELLNTPPPTICLS